MVDCCLEAGAAPDTRRSLRRTRPVQEVAFLGMTLALGLLLETVVIPTMSDAIG